MRKRFDKRLDDNPVAVIYFVLDNLRSEATEAFLAGFERFILYDTRILRYRRHGRCPTSDRHPSSAEYSLEACTISGLNMSLAVPLSSNTIMRFRTPIMFAAIPTHS